MIVIKILLSLLKIFYKIYLQKELVRINRPTLLGEIKEYSFDFAPGLTGFAGQSESYKSLPASAIDCFRIKKSQSFQELNFVDWNQNVHTRAYMF